MTTTEREERSAGFLIYRPVADGEFLRIHNYDVDGKPKTVHYWLAKLIAPLDVVLSHEHQSMKWLGLEDAVSMSKFKQMGEMLRDADKYLKEKA